MSWHRRKIVERAKGLLMAKEGITEDDAYGRIRRASQRTGRPMRAIADALVATLSGEGV
jgi:response regulator NasT